MYLLKPGDKVYLDLLSGVLRGVLVGSETNFGDTRLLVRVTSRNNRVYSRGEIVSTHICSVLPRAVTRLRHVCGIARVSTQAYGIETRGGVVVGAL
jgi:hypothetical protein